ncbi:unnamed protein product, partial [Mesorhabditis belari]|uniref:C2 domain-containing protein n=1 Tax=Mesorhabditis belari TaxID=2138241 RepID=A0AAF3J2K0_9BILA
MGEADKRKGKTLLESHSKHQMLTSRPKIRTTSTSSTKGRSDSCQGCKHSHLPHSSRCALDWVLCESLPTAIPVFDVGEIVENVRVSRSVSPGPFLHDYSSKETRGSSMSSNCSGVFELSSSPHRSNNHLEAIWIEQLHNHHHNQLKPGASGPLQKTVSYLRNKLDGAMSTGQLYPSREEVRQWETDFEALITHKFGCALFRDYLKKELSDENIDFWVECEEFKRMKEGKKETQKKAQEIFNTYVKDQAPREVNLDSATKAATKAAFEGGCGPDAFSLAQSRIQQLMEKDSYRRFLKDIMFTDLLNGAIENGSSDK